MVEMSNRVVCKSHFRHPTTSCICLTWTGLGTAGRIKVLTGRFEKGVIWGCGGGLVYPKPVKGHVIPNISMIDSTQACWDK